MTKKLLGRRVARFRRERGITQEQLAERVGYSVEFISLVERGINAPSVDGLEKLADVFGVPIKDLFDFSSPCVQLGTPLAGKETQG